MEKTTTKKVTRKQRIKTWPDGHALTLESSDGWILGQHTFPNGKEETFHAYEGKVTERVFRDWWHRALRAIGK